MKNICMTEIKRPEDMIAFLFNAMLSNPLAITKRDVQDLVAISYYAGQHKIGLDSIYEKIGLI